MGYPIRGSQISGMVRSGSSSFLPSLVLIASLTTSHISTLPTSEPNVLIVIISIDSVGNMRVFFTALVKYDR